MFALNVSTKETLKQCNCVSLLVRDPSEVLNVFNHLKVHSFDDSFAEYRNYLYMHVVNQRHY